MQTCVALDLDSVYGVLFVSKQDISFYDVGYINTGGDIIYTGGDIIYTGRDIIINTVGDIIYTGEI